jgi:CRISPR-associated protein Cmr2
MEAASPLADTCRALVCALRKHASAAPAHAGAPTLEDHLLTSAALVACLVAEHPQRDLLRLAALAHDQPDAERRSDDPAFRAWVALLREHGTLLDRGDVPEIPAGGPEQQLALAHLAASRRLPVAQKQDFAAHPLADAPLVDLVYGGATRIKQYVFESARLPEIRGASALLDHINRLDLPALWGLEPLFAAGGDVGAAQQRRYAEVRTWFGTHFGTEALDAPECVLYASGGNILALAPAGQGAQLAQAIERRYTEVTQIAASVAVAEQFHLLELQYGRAPKAFWVDDARRLLASNSDAAALLAQSYGVADPAKHLAAIFGADSLSGPGALPPKEEEVTAHKGFGELVTLLAALADRRRAGDGAGTGAPRFPVFFDLPSAARRCSSCDVRPATRHLENPSQDLCEACSLKRKAGLAAKKGPRGESKVVPDESLDWIEPWGAWLETKSRQLKRSRDINATVDTLPDIAEAASGQAGGFVGLVYADGNNVGAYIAKLSSIAAYRRFAQHMLDANEQAVALALIEHLGPTERNKVWPFEIITIGGDDVLLFVPADRAPAVAATIAREFGQAMRAHDTQITLSAGMLLMADHTPIRFARDLVEALLKSAKQRSKDGDKGATIDFMALKAASMVSETIGAYRGAAFQRVRKRRNDPEHPTRLSLTQRPYTLDGFETLIRAGRTLRQVSFPASQLHQLAEIIGEGQQLRASVDYRYFVGRGRDRAGYAEFERMVGALCGPEDSAPWRKVKGAPRPEYDTPLLDLVEILPFVGAAEREERA